MVLQIELKEIISHFKKSWSSSVNLDEQYHVTIYPSALLKKHRALCEPKGEECWIKNSSSQTHLLHCQVTYSDNLIRSLYLWNHIHDRGKA